MWGALGEENSSGGGASAGAGGETDEDARAHTHKHKTHTLASGGGMRDQLSAEHRAGEAVWAGRSVGNSDVLRILLQACGLGSSQAGLRAEGSGSAEPRAAEADNRLRALGVDNRSRALSPQRRAEGSGALEGSLAGKCEVMSKARLAKTFQKKDVHTVQDRFSLGFP